MKLNKYINPRVSELKKHEEDWSYANLARFIKALKKHIRGIKFGIKKLTSPPVNSDSKIYAYMEGSPYAMGWVAYADFRDNPESHTPMYTVCSHTIHNGKYSSGEQMRMKMTTNFDVGIKNAKRHLRNLTTHDIALADKDDIKSQFAKKNYKANENVEDIMRKVLPRYTSDKLEMKKFVPELRHLIDTGHEWIDKSYGSQLVEFIKAYDEKIEADNRTLDVIFVRAFTKLDKTVFETMEINNLHHNSGEKGEVVTYDDTTLPRELAGKISTLNMLGQGQYVEGVGLYHGDYMYYVVK